MDIPVIEQFAREHQLPRAIIERFLNESFEQASLKIHPNKKLIFDISSKKYFEILEGNPIEHELNTIGRRLFLLSSFIFADKLQKLDPVKFKITPKADNAKIKNSFKHWFDEDSDYGSYCSACQQSPCMCSDREATSTVHDF